MAFQVLIPPSILDPTDWEPSFAEPSGRLRYKTFCALVMERIRNGYSNDSEVARFIAMVCTSHNRDFLFLAGPTIPELMPGGLPSDCNDQVRRVVDSVHEQLRKQFLLPRGLEKLSSSVGDLSEEDRAKIATLMFGPRGEEGATVRMKSLLNSMIEMGFPQAAMEDAENRGGVELDDSGLPMNLRTPEASNAETPPAPPAGLNTNHLRELRPPNIENPDGSLFPGQVDTTQPVEVHPQSHTDEEEQDDPPTDLLAEVSTSPDDTDDMTHGMIIINGEIIRDTDPFS